MSHPEQPDAVARRVVRVDADIADLARQYLDNRRQDIAMLLAALAAADYRTIYRVGHTLRGDAPAFGFEALADVGRALEQAAETRDAAAVQRLTATLADYVATVEVIPD